MPRFDSYNRTALMDLHGRRIAAKAHAGVARGGQRLAARSTSGVRWTRSCYCGQEVEPGHRVSDEPFWGLAFFGGSEDGASIFHEPASTEGRRLPADARTTPSTGARSSSRRGLVHETVPEVHVIRSATACCSARRASRASRWGGASSRRSRPQLPPGVKDPFVVGLANDYMGYLTTPEEYEMQHYEGGHTVYGTATSLLALDVFVELTATLSSSQPSPRSLPAAGARFHRGRRARGRRRRRRRRAGQRPAAATCDG